MFYEVAKVCAGFVAGFLAKWWFSRMSSRAADIRQSLRLLSSMSRNAEAATRTIISGAPDHLTAAGVMADRTTLMNSIRSALGKRTNFPRVEACFTAYALSLSCADPHFGGASEAAITKMRDCELELDRAIRRLAHELWSWRLYGHERTS